jgi:hypothetical protein
MTQPQTVERGPRLPVRQRPAALTAVCAGRMLAHLSPRHIRAVLTLLRRHAAPASYQQAKNAHDAILATSVLCGGRYCLQLSLGHHTAVPHPRCLAHLVHRRTHRSLHRPRLGGSRQPTGRRATKLGLLPPAHRHSPERF